SPGDVQRARVSELSASHIDDVGGLGQRGDLFPVEQVAGNRFHAPGLEVTSYVRIAEPSHADDAFIGCGAFGKACEGRAHFARYAQYENVAFELRQIINQLLAWPRHELV